MSANTKQVPQSRERRSTTMTRIKMQAAAALLDKPDTEKELVLNAGIIMQPVPRAAFVGAMALVGMTAMVLVASGGLVDALVELHDKTVADVYGNESAARGAAQEVTLGAPAAEGVGDEPSTEEEKRRGAPEDLDRDASGLDAYGVYEI